MLQTEEFGNFLLEQGFNFISGVPCSYLKNLINFGYNSGIYHNSANEGDALALASGAQVAGKNPIVMMQNSGLGNIVSPLTSLNLIFKIPVLGFVSLRTGEPGERQHEVMGNITQDLLNTMGIPNDVLPNDIELASEAIQLAQNRMIETKKPFFFVVKKDTFSTCKLQNEALTTRTDGTMSVFTHQGEERPSRFDTLNLISDFAKEDTVVIGTTGKTGRELFMTGDRPNYLYVVGSMGLASAFATGIALNTKKKVIVIDGDGAALMRLSVMPMIASELPKNLLHVLLDNQIHDSTGGQSTLSTQIHWVKFASNVGYEYSTEVGYHAIESELHKWKMNGGLRFLYIKTKPGSQNPLPRPDIEPEDVAIRLKEFLKC